MFSRRIVFALVVGLWCALHWGQAQNYFIPLTPPPGATQVARSGEFQWLYGTNAVVNGGFEDSFQLTKPGWQETPSKTPTWNLVGSGSIEGRTSLLTVFPNRSATKSLWQEVQLPSDGRALTFTWMERIQSLSSMPQNRASGESFKVSLRSAADAPLAVFQEQVFASGTITNAWRRHVVSLDAWAGNRVRIQFDLTGGTNGVSGLRAYLDGVSVLVGTTGAVFQVFAGTDPDLGPSNQLGETTGLKWPFRKLATGKTNYWKLQARNGGQTISSPVFQFVTQLPPPFGRFELVRPPDAPFANSPYPIKLRALGKDDTLIPDFEGTATASVIDPRWEAPNLVFTAVDRELLWIHNVSTGAVSLKGWECDVYGRRGGRPDKQILFPENSKLDPGESVAIPLGLYPSSSIQLAAQILPANLPAPLPPDWAAVLWDPHGENADTIVVGQFQLGTVVAPRPLEDWAWTGPGLPEDRTWIRSGNRSTRSNADWVLDIVEFLDRHLELPLLSGLQGQPATPIPGLNFVNGEWSGTLTLQRPMFDPVLRIQLATNSYAVTETIPLASVVSSPGLQLNASTTTIVEGATPSPTALRLRLESTQTRDVQVRLRAQPEGVLNLPLSVIIPAGKSVGDLSIEALNDDTFNPNRSVVITAEANGFNPTSIRLRVADDDTPEIQVELPELIAEGESVETVVRVSHPLAVPLEIHLSAEGLLSWDRSTPLIDKDVVLPAGATSIPITIHALVDSLIDGDNSAAIVASSQRTTTTRRSLTVTSRLNVNPIVEVFGPPGSSARTMAISLFAGFPAPVTIGLEASPAGLFEPLPPVTLAPFTPSVFIPLALTGGGTGTTTPVFDLSIQLPGLPSIVRRVSIPPVWPHRIDVALPNSARSAGIPLPFVVRSFDDRGNPMPFGAEAMAVDLVDAKEVPLPVVDVKTGELTPQTEANEARIRVKIGPSIGFSEPFAISPAPSNLTLPFPSTSLTYHEGRQLLFSGVPPDASTERNSLLGIDPTTGQIQSRTPLPAGFNIDPNGVKLSPDGSLALLSCNNRRRLCLIEVGSGNVRWFVEADHGASNPEEFFGAILEVRTSPWQCIVTRYGKSPELSFIPLDADRVDASGATTVPGLKIWAPMPAVEGTFLATGASAPGEPSMALRIHLAPDGTVQKTEVTASTYLVPLENFLPHLSPLSGDWMLTYEGSLRNARTGQWLRQFDSVGFPLFENGGSTGCFLGSDNTIQRVRLQCFDVASGAPLARFHLGASNGEVIGAVKCASGLYAWSSSLSTHLVRLQVADIPGATAGLSFSVEAVDQPVRVGLPAQLRLTLRNQRSDPLTNLNLNLAFNDLQLSTTVPGTGTVPGNTFEFNASLARLEAGAAASWTVTASAVVAGRARIFGEATFTLATGVRVLPIDKPIDVLPNPNESRIAAWNLESPSTVAWNSLQQRLYTVRDGKIISLDPFTGESAVLGSTGGELITSIVLDSESRYLYVTTSTLKIHRMDVTGKEAPLSITLPADWKYLSKLMPLPSRPGSFICALVPTQFNGDMQYSEFAVFDGDQPRPVRARVFDSVGRFFELVPSSDPNTVMLIGLSQDQALPLRIRKEGVELSPLLNNPSDAIKFAPFRAFGEWYDFETRQRLPGGGIGWSEFAQDAALGRIVRVESRLDRTIMVHLSDEGSPSVIGSTQLPAPSLGEFALVTPLTLGRGVVGGTWHSTFFAIRDPLISGAGLTDLSVNFISPPVQTSPGESIEYRFRVQNSGNHPATNVTAYISSTPQTVAIQRTDGSVQHIPQSSMRTPLGTLSPGESLEVAFQAHFTHPGTVRPYVILSSSNPDSHRENNIAITTLEVSGPDWIQSRQEIAAHPTAMAYRHSDGCLYVNEVAGIAQIDPKTGQVTGRRPSTRNARQLLFSADEQELFSVDAYSGKLFRRHLESNTESEWLTHPGGPISGVCFLDRVPNQPGALIIAGRDPNTQESKTILVRPDGSVAPKSLPYVASLLFPNDGTTGVFSTAGCGGVICGSNLLRFQSTAEGLSVVDGIFAIGNCGRLIDLGDGRFFQSTTLFNFGSLQSEQHLVNTQVEYSRTDWDPISRRLWSVEGVQWIPNTPWVLREYDVHTGIARHTLPLPGVGIPIQLLVLTNNAIAIADQNQLQILHLKRQPSPEVAMEFTPPSGTWILTNENILQARVTNRGQVAIREMHVGFAIPAAISIVGLSPDTGSVMESMGVGGQALWVIPNLPPGGTAALTLQLIPQTLLESRMPILISAENLPDKIVDVPISISDNFNGDFDRDGLPDTWELANGLSPGDPTDAQNDDDNDSATNIDEYRAGTDPQDAFDIFIATASIRSAGILAVTCPSKPGKRYGVQFKRQQSEDWKAVGDPKPGTGGQLTFEILIGNEPDAGFLRLVIQ